MFRLRLSVQSPGTIQCSGGLSMAPNGRWLLLRPPLAACSQVCTAGRRPRFKARITSSQITSTTTAVIRRSTLVTLSRPWIDELDNDQARPVVIGYPLLLIPLDVLLDRYQRGRLAEKDQHRPLPQRTATTVRSNRSRQARGRTGQWRLDAGCKPLLRLPVYVAFLWIPPHSSSSSSSSS
jgi:hypothetical protein